MVWLRGPVHTGTDNPARIYRSRGGSAANVAAYAATLVPTRFIGRVGADALGSELVGELRGSGVDVRVQRGGHTGTIVLLVDTEAERTMFPDRGAAAELGPVPPEWLDGVEVLHLPAYTFATECGADSALAMTRVLRDRGGAVTIDASSTAMLAGYGPDRFLGLVHQLRPAVLFANAAEARLLGLDGATPPPGTVFVVKNGGGPTTVTGAGGPYEPVPPPAATPRDTTGAGDSFAAGYLAAMMRGAGPADAVAAGHRLAATVLNAPGAGSPTRENA